MRYKVFNPETDIANGIHFDTYFKTKKEAVAFQKIHGGIIYRRMTRTEWLAYK